jgi:hypothetical protein
MIDQRLSENAAAAIIRQITIEMIAQLELYMTGAWLARSGIPKGLLVASRLFFHFRQTQFVSLTAWTQVLITLDSPSSHEQSLSCQLGSLM